MFKVADYLIQVQADIPKKHDSARLRPLDTRGAGPAWTSLGVLLVALFKIIIGKFSGRLAGVHVNVAERLSLFRKGALIVFCRFMGVPVVLHLHAAQLHSTYERFPRIVQGMVRWMFRQATCCVVLGKVSQRFVVSVLKVDSEKVHIVVNGVMGPAKCSIPCVDGQEIKILFLGNLMERKGVSDLLRALARPEIADLNLFTYFAGGGDKEKYEALARNLGIESRVKFVGWANQGRVAELLSEAALLILPSYDEGLPLVILEALANCVPVICTPVGEIPNYLTDEQDVLFIEPGNLASIAFAIRSLALDQDRRRRLGIGGRAVFESRFSIAAFFEQIGEIHLLAFGTRAELDSTTQLTESMVQND